MKHSSPTCSTSCSGSDRSKRCCAIRRCQTFWSTGTTWSIIEREGKLEETEIVFKDDRHLQQIIERIVSSVGRRIDESSPMVDARLQDGSRVNAIIPPLALDGAVLSIRRFRTDRLGAQDLVARESLTQPMLEFLKAAVACRLNVIVSGGTGAGKTTLLNILSSFIGHTERIVTIEDAAELMLRQRHVVRLETRPANIEGKGAVKQRDLVVNALRMRPDRIIMGEVRSEEALDMLQAMNTGHDGSLTTIHSNSARDALYRLDTMVAMANLSIPERAIRQQIASAINLIVQITRQSDGTRTGHRHHRDHRDGRRSDHDAGAVPVREDRASAGRQGLRTLQGDRASGRSAASVWRRPGFRLAGGHVRTHQSRRVKERYDADCLRLFRRRLDRLPRAVLAVRARVRKCRRIARWHDGCSRRAVVHGSEPTSLVNDVMAPPSSRARASNGRWCGSPAAVRPLERLIERSGYAFDRSGRSFSRRAFAAALGGLRRCCNLSIEPIVAAGAARRDRQCAVRRSSGTRPGDGWRNSRSSSRKRST